MSKILLNSMNEGTGEMLQWVQKRIRGAKTYISIYLQIGTKLVNRTTIIASDNLHCNG